MALKRCAKLLAVVAIASLTTITSAATRHPHVDSLNANSRAIFATAMEWGDRYFDAASSLSGEMREGRLNLTTPTLR